MIHRDTLRGRMAVAQALREMHRTDAANAHAAVCEGRRKRAENERKLDERSKA